jgi:hypothetical protein
MQCWGTIRPHRAPCERSATTWLFASNIQFAVCDRHAQANPSKPQRRMRTRMRSRASAH